MYLSKLFIPITKDLPAEAKIKSHQLSKRWKSAGFIWLPLGFKVMKNKIVKRGINGAQEALPIFNLWNMKESGRYEDYGEECLELKIARCEMLYGQLTKLITDIFRYIKYKSYKSSHKDLV